jgi:hypothetical protein
MLYYCIKSKSFSPKDIHSLWDRGLNSKKPWKVLKLACAFLNSLISKRLFSTILNEKDYSYDIYEPINLLILKGESHGISALRGRKKNISISSGSNFIVRGIWKSCYKSKKGMHNVSCTVKKSNMFLQISQELVVIS